MERKYPSVSYGEHEKKIAAGGADAIRKVLFSGDEAASMKLLVCLDGFFDPYYGRRLPYENEVAAMLEELILTSDSDDIIDEAINLLGYAEMPLTHLREHAGEVKESMRPYVNELLSWK